MASQFVAKEIQMMVEMMSDEDQRDLITTVLGSPHAVPQSKAGRCGTEAGSPRRAHPVHCHVKLGQQRRVSEEKESVEGRACSLSPSMLLCPCMRTRQLRAAAGDGSLGHGHQGRDGRARPGILERCVPSAIALSCRQHAGYM